MHCYYNNLFTIIIKLLTHSKLMTAFCILYSDDGITCPNGNIRLVHMTDSYSNSYGRSEGRLEVCYNNEWGTVCSDGWNNSDATVACKQLGYYDYIDYNSTASNGSGSVWLTYLNCSGVESSLFCCATSPIEENNCNSSEDVIIKCYCELCSPS